MKNNNDKRLFNNETATYTTRCSEVSDSESFFIFKILGFFVMVIYLLGFGFDFYTVVILLVNIYLYLMGIGVKYRKLRYKKRTSKEKLSIEGLIEDRDFLKFDKNKDGYIDLYEYYSKSDDEVEKLIKSKGVDFSKEDFYSYIKKSFFIIDKGIAEENPLVFSGYLNYSFYKQMSKKIRNKMQEVKLSRIKGIILKDCKISSNIMIIKVAITLIRKDKNKNEVFILTYLNNLNDENCENNNCINCGAKLKIGLCDYCKTYNYIAYKGFILSDMIPIRISGD